MPGEFLDTRILVYAFSTDPKSAVARSLLARRCLISVQGLNEFANVARRKLNMTWSDLHAAIGAIRALCDSVAAMDVDTHVDALRIAERHSYSIFDALMIATALKSGSDTLWSEDMQHGAIIDAKLRIANPFVPP